MKRIKRGKAGVQKQRCSSRLRNQSGYVLVYVLILMLVAGLIMGPFLSFMISGLHVTKSYSEALASFYAADSGIEDAIYRIQRDYVTTLRSDVSQAPWNDIVKVESTATFPPQGVLLIEDEFIQYTGIENNNFTGCTRETNPWDTWPPEHAKGTPVILSIIGIPPSPADPDAVPWEYTLAEEINGSKVEVSIENKWLLDGLEDRMKGTHPHSELLVTGEVTEIRPAEGYGIYRIDITYDGSSIPGNVKLDRIGVQLPPGFAYVSSEPVMTTLTEGINSTQDYIPVANTALFPPQGVLRIEDELIQYTDIDSDNNWFIGCIRDVDMATSHSANTLIYSQPVTTKLSDDIDSAKTAIEVDSIDLFPDAGVIRIEDELIQYDGIQFGRFQSCIRGVNGTAPAGHLEDNSVTLVPLTTTLKNNIGAADDDIQVIDADLFPDKGVLRIGGELIRYDDESGDTFRDCTRGVNGTTAAAHSKPVATTLAEDISSDPAVDVIPVEDTDGFPEQGTICIDDEVIRYTGMTDDAFTGCIRGISGSKLASHSQYTPVVSDGRLVIFKPVTTTLRNDIDSGDLTIPVVSTDQFPEQGVLCIDSELIRYESKTSSQFTVGDVNDRGFGESDATAHSSGALVTSDPKEICHHLGTTLVWDFSPPGVEFKDLPMLTTPVGGLQPSTEFPMRRSLILTFTPAQPPKGIFCWIRTTRHDVYLSWDKTSAIYKITSTATDQATGRKETIESYTAKSRLRDRISQIYGDYRAIGNSLVYDSNDDGWRDTWLPKSSATITKSTSPEGTEIPGDAKVEAAYLYWAGWWQQAAADREVTLKLDDNDPMTITAGTDDWLIDKHPKREPGTGSPPAPDPQAYAYTCYADVTDYIAEISTPLTSSDTATYTITVGGVSANVDPLPGPKPGSTWTYAAWSLIIIYSSVHEDAHQLYFYDAFHTNIFHAYQETLHYPIEGFLAPDEADTSLTYFVGEGDEGISGDSIRFKGESDTEWLYLSDEVNPQTNVMNSRSSGIGCELEFPFGDGIDIDTFNITYNPDEPHEPSIRPGDTSAQLDVITHGDGWDLVYIVLSFRTIPTSEYGLFPAGIITYSYGGG